MILEDLIALARAALMDQQVPHLWSDEALAGYFNEAVQEACERAKLIEDSATEAVCRISTVAGQAEYALHASVLEVKRLTFNGHLLHETSIEDLDRQTTAWEAREGLPVQFVFESPTGAAKPRVRLVPAPSMAGVLRLRAYRGALKPLSADVPTGKPEIAERFHVKLIDWVCRCAYMRPDPDGYDPGKAQMHEGLFERNFGVRPDANVQRKRRDKRPRIVNMKGSW